MIPAWGAITITDILEPIQGVLANGCNPGPIAGVSTDSRTLQEGELFWALKGDLHDGHDFVLQALDRGARGAVVERSWWLEKENILAGRGRPSCRENSGIIHVKDTLWALGDLAKWWRQRHPAKVAALTGSSGKTTAKEMAAAIFNCCHVTLKNQGNWNNLIGLPLTLLGLTSRHDRAVLEMGMNAFGEIARLTDIADPDVGAILNVGQAHLEGVGSMDGVARAKTEMVEKMSVKGKVILNGDDEILLRHASRFRTDFLTFGLKAENHVRATDIQDHGLKGTSFLLWYEGHSWPVALNLPGRHQVYNALAASAMAMSLKEPPDHILEGLAVYRGMRGRFSGQDLPGGVTLIDDTYNANPSSLEAALTSLAFLAREERRLIVGLGDMRELGAFTEKAHEEAGQKVARSHAALLLALGTHAPWVIQGALAEGMPRERAREVQTHQNMASSIIAFLQKGDVILLKGSRKMAMEKVVLALEEQTQQGRI